MLKSNLIANWIGQGWIALMGIAFVPLYIKYLGIEAYGLIGFFILLQNGLSIFDMGMSPTLTREMARFTGTEDNTKEIRKLLRSIEIIVLITSLAIISGIHLFANWLSISWINSKSISSEDVANAITLMGLVIGTRFLETMYVGTIRGLQRQVLLNVVQMTMATLRGAGAVIILAFFSPSIHAFFLWQALISLISILVLGIATYNFIPKDGNSGEFSWPALLRIKNYAGGMIGISLLSLALTQSDKVILSKILSLSDFGVYTLASILALSLYTLISPITIAWFPRLTQLKESGDQVGLVSKFHQGAQLVSIIGGSAALVIIFQGETFLRLWTQDAALAEKVSPILSVMTFGYLLNIFIWIPFQTHLAHGSTILPMQINLVAVLLIVPALILVTPHFGVMGATWIWVALNLGYFIIGVYFLFQKILPKEKWRWYWNDIIIPLVPVTVSMFLLGQLLGKPITILSQVFVLSLYITLALSVSIFFSPLIRHQLFKLLLYWFNVIKIRV